MSDKHGGFFVRSLDPAIAEPIRVALAAALHGRNPACNRLSFAAIPGCPVIHVDVCGMDLDDAYRDPELGAQVARAARAEVWAYYYENQSGSEGVRQFHADGTAGSAESCEWDELGAGDLGEVMAAAPLGKLAAQLGIARRTLEYDLTLLVSRVSVSLAEPCTAATTAYLAGIALEGKDCALQSIYFPSPIASEIQAHARRLGISPGTLAVAAWELAKAELHATTPPGDSLDEPGSAAVMPVAPPGLPPPMLTIPGHADAAVALPSKPDSTRLTLALPERMLRELAAFARAADCSLSWGVEKAYVMARDRLLVATRREPSCPPA